MEIGLLDSDRKQGEESLRWLENYLKGLPIIGAQNVIRAVSDPEWLSEANLRKRAKHCAKVARLRAKARAEDLEGFRRTEAEGRARRRKAERDRDRGRASAARAATRERILKEWPTASDALGRSLGMLRRHSEE
jgi:hypothetical protein